MQCKSVPLLLLPAIFASTSAQLYNTGIGKTTHSISNAVAALSWFQDHLPCFKQTFQNKCDDIYCKCGQIGRVSLETADDGNLPSNYTSDLGGFAIHTVHTNSSSMRPLGRVPIEQVETAMTEKFNVAASASSYDAFLDFNTGLWVGDLDPYLKEFAGSPIVPIEWKDTVNSRVYYSFMVQVPHSLVLVEFMSAKQTNLPTKRYMAPRPRFHFKKGQTPEHIFGNLTQKSGHTDKLLLHAARVSHFTSNLSRDLEFYTQVMRATVLEQVVDVGGVRTLAMDFSGYTAKPNYVQLHLVERPQSNTTGSFSVSDLEDVMNGVHNFAVKSDVCGFDQWMDTHYNIQVDRNASSAAPTMGELFKNLDERGIKYHFLSGTGTFVGDIAYALTPNGIGVEIKGMKRGSYVPSATPGISFDVGGLCFIGNTTVCGGLHQHSSSMQFV